ncbi:MULTISPECIES: hypothetical protein [Aeromonas]|uniref:hypothetical protein n=1 Tax=Aeromonas TaxID=642 RepID=UPI00106FFCB5|nr:MULTISPECIES: hypothetical protein [Aeromonas]ELB2792626.1 hypothetical protein [Aeromonas hydrophila]MBS2782560.1 hypothetical protein [Aeromonas salmonicida]
MKRKRENRDHYLGFGVYEDRIGSAARRLVSVIEIGMLVEILNVTTYHNKLSPGDTSHLWRDGHKAGHKKAPLCGAIS